MTALAFLPAHHCVGLGRRVLLQLRASLERDAAHHAAALLQEAGFAGGEEMYGAFSAWLAAEYGVDRPADLEVRHLSGALGRFFEQLGWGRLAAQPLGPAVLALDASEWAEAAGGGGDYPSCHLSCGLLADFLGRIADGLVAVMEVECRSRGDTRCRFLAGAPETLSTLYERMARGMGYSEALGLKGNEPADEPSAADEPNEAEVPARIWVD